MRVNQVAFRDIGCGVRVGGVVCATALHGIRVCVSQSRYSPGSGSIDYLLGEDFTWITGKSQDLS